MYTRMWHETENLKAKNDEFDLPIREQLIEPIQLESKNGQNANSFV